MSTDAAGPKITTTAVLNLRPRAGRRLDFRDVEAAAWHHVPSDGLGRVEVVLMGVSTWTAEAAAFIARNLAGAGTVVVRGNTKPAVLEAFRQALIVAGERIRREEAREARAGSTS